MILKKLKNNIIEMQVTTEELKLLRDGVYFNLLEPDREEKLYQLIGEFFRQYEEINEEGEEYDKTV